MYKPIICLIFILNVDFIHATSVADSWILFSKALNNAFMNCPVTLGIFDCLRHSSLDVFDKMITSDVIPFTTTMGVRFERYRHNRSIRLDTDTNDTSKQSGYKGSSLTNEFWSEHVLKKIVDLFKTHTLNIDFIPRSMARHRRRNHMLPMMIFGVTALGAFTIPMGFQFLSIISGKALLLAKMALMFAMINGLKRVASSGVHYGLYHSDPHQHGYHYIDREDINRPRSIDM